MKVRLRNPGHVPGFRDRGRFQQNECLHKVRPLHCRPDPEAPGLGPGQHDGFPNPIEERDQRSDILIVFDRVTESRNDVDWCTVLEIRYTELRHAACS